MAIGRRFEETIQKALRMMDESCTGFGAERLELEMAHRGDAFTSDHVNAELQKLSPMRTWAIAKAFGFGSSVDEVHSLTRIGRRFLEQLHYIHRVQQSLRSLDLLELASHPCLLREAKHSGFAVRQIATHL